MALVLPMSLLRQSQGQPELGVAQPGRWQTRVTMRCEVGSTSGGIFVSDVLQDIKDRVQIDRRCNLAMKFVHLQANQPSSSSLLVGAGSGAPGFDSEIGSLT